MHATEVQVAIIGGGLGGLAMAVYLKRAGFHDFVVLEEAAGPGGTWYKNTYPGCAVDVPSEIYSYSFLPFDWTRIYATQAEILRYIEFVIERFSLRRHFRFSTRVREVVWDQARSGYRIRLENLGEMNARFVVSAVGFLNVPKLPALPGMESFRGPLFHTANWEHQHELWGKRVAIIGTGSTACQLVPELAGKVAHLKVFQREAGWVAPKVDRELTQKERLVRRRNPIRRKLSRWRGFLRHARSVAFRTVGSRAHKQLTSVCLQAIDTQVHDENLKGAVTPAYPVGCKRLVRDSKYYAALNEPQIELVNSAVVRITPGGLIDAHNVEHSADVIILATGFHTTDYLRSLRVVGPRGISLHKLWNGEPRAYMGITVDGIPNFFVMYGPNTNGGGSIIAQHERQAAAIVRTLKRMRRGGYRVVDTKISSMARFLRWVDKENTRRWSALYADCGNYYLSRSGRNVTQWPKGQLSYFLRTVFVFPFGLRLRR